MSGCWVYRTRWGTFAIVPHGRRFHAMFENEGLGPDRRRVKGLARDVQGAYRGCGHAGKHAAPASGSDARQAEMRQHMRRRSSDPRRSLLGIVWIVMFVIVVILFTAQLSEFLLSWLRLPREGY